jgi:hypothetical protein
VISISMLHDAYLRADRAGEHFKDLQGLAASYVEANRAASFIKVNGMAVTSVMPPEPPPMFGVRVGEIAYNLRAALDYLVYRLAEIDAGKVVNGTQFPIEETAKGFGLRRTRFLNGVNNAHVAAIEALQPYRGVDWTRLLRDLSNMDKHRALHIIGYVAEDSVRVNVGGTEAEAHAFGGFRMPGDDVSMYYPAPIRVAFTDGTPIDVPLEQLLTETRKVLDAFNPEFKGHLLERNVKQTLAITPIRIR